MGNESRRLDWIVCAGGYRTGSTFQYNLIGRFLELTGQGCRVGYGSCHEVTQPLNRIGVVKSHALGGWEWYIVRDMAEAVRPIRDREAVEQSMVRFFDIPYSDLPYSDIWREDELNHRLWQEVDHYRQSYDWMLTSPVTSLRSFVRQIDRSNLQWDEGMAKLAAEYAQGVGPDDPLSLIHENHRQTA